MALLGSLAFASPWILSALLLVPLAYLIIRAIPPAPRRLFFPATWLTRELLSENLTSKSAPWWLIALRLLMLIILILALSGPFMRSDDPITADADAILLIDNDWSSAADWDARKALAQEKLERLLSGERRVAIVPTAAPAGGWSAALPRFETAGAARQRLGVLSPRPWSPDYAAVAQHLAGLRNTGHAGSITYITNGIDHGEAATLIDALKQTPAVDIIALKHARLAQIAIAAVKSTAQGFDILLLRTDGQGPQNVVVAITDRTGTVLARMPAAFERGAARLDVSIEVMPQVRSRVARLAIEGARHAGATYIFDARAQRPLVGLVAQSGAALVQPLQTPDYYLSRALQPFANLQRGEVTALLKQDVSVLLLPDQARLPEAQEDAVLAWVQRGGLLLRFAGPNMFAADTVREDALLPAGLRAQPRIIGGALSWSKAQPLAEFAADSPFYGVALAQDIAVEQHALMRSGATAQAQIWARLVDGTPLVSARSAGTGTLVLFHTSANATWSNLALSGTFVEMLQRILELSVPDAGRDSVVSDAMMLTRALTAKGTLAAATSNDGSGQLPPIAKSVLLKTAAGPLHPPGIYEGQRSVLSLNLASAAGPLTPRTQLYPLQEAASGLPYRSVDGPQERSLAAPLFTALLCLAFIDMVVTLLLNGTLLRRPSIPRFQRGAAALVVLLASACLIHPQLATAQT
ncbi:MAG: BatA domain-containing protein, partial [Pseudomonadota bacterium]